MRFLLGRRLLPLAFVSVLVTAFVACASSGDEVNRDHPSPPEASIPDGGDAPMADAASPDVAVSGPKCSEAGWCETPLPDSKFAITDVWPLEGRAFALAFSRPMSSAHVGNDYLKVLEWTDAEASWKSIDDNTQNDLTGQALLGGIWAPNDDTVYFVVVTPGGAGRAFVYRGTRRPPPASDWSWSHWELEDHLHPGDPAHATDYHSMANTTMLGSYNTPVPAIGVWGVDAGDVYAWYSNTIYHFVTDDSGAAGWPPVYIADDWDSDGEELFFLSAGGSGSDDVWFAGSRAAHMYSVQNVDLVGSDECAVLVHKTSSGFTRIVDATLEDVPSPPGFHTCAARPGFSFLGGAQGWLSDVQSTGPGSLTGLKGGHDILRISTNGDGLAVEVDPVPKFSAPRSSETMGTFRSMWRAPSADWLTSYGLVVRGQGTGDAGTYAVSTIALDGNPIEGNMYRVRGTSDINIWATGDGYALHKTTP